ncbi:MAG: hypothetical protein QXQ02_00025 [Halobacteria archaeon]
MNVTCVSCPYLFKTQMLGYGECRRFPPQVLFQGTTLAVVFPLVKLDEHVCGEHPEFMLSRIDAGSKDCVSS